MSRPNYGPAGSVTQPSTAAAEESEDDEPAEEAEVVVKPRKTVKAETTNDDGPVAVKAPSKLDRFKYSKKNHEATSDEEE